MRKKRRFNGKGCIGKKLLANALGI